MTILVTGGAGFIGSNFIYYLLKEHPEDRVLCVDCLTYAGNLSTLKEALEKPSRRPTSATARASMRSSRPRSPTSS